MFDKKLIFAFIVMIGLVVTSNVLKNCSIDTVRLVTMAFLISWGGCICIIAKNAKKL